MSPPCQFHSPTYTPTCVSTHTHAHMCMHPHMCRDTCVYTHAHIHTPTLGHAHANAHTCTHTPRGILVLGLQTSAVSWPLVLSWYVSGKFLTSLCYHVLIYKVAAIIACTSKDGPKAPGDLNQCLAHSRCSRNARYHSSPSEGSSILTPRRTLSHLCEAAGRAQRRCRSLCSVWPSALGTKHSVSCRWRMLP